VPGRLTGPAMLWGAAAGLGSLAGIVALNLGLASGSMAAVAPVAAVTAALVPLAGGLLNGDRPGFAAIVGAAAAVGAIILVSGAWSAADASRRERPGGLFAAVWGRLGARQGITPAGARSSHRPRLLAVWGRLGARQGITPAGARSSHRPRLLAVWGRLGARQG